MITIIINDKITKIETKIKLLRGKIILPLKLLIEINSRILNLFVFIAINKAIKHMNVYKENRTEFAVSAIFFTKMGIAK